METILLDIGLPPASWLGIVVTLILSLLAWALNNAYNNAIRRIESLELRLDIAEKEAEKEKLNVKTMVTNLHLNILERLDTIKDKFNEFRK